MKLDRDKLDVVDLHDGGEAFDRAYWREKSPIERLRAVEMHRLVAYGQTDTSRRLQRVLEVVELNKQAAGRYKDLDDLENLPEDGVTPKEPRTK